MTEEWPSDKMTAVTGQEDKEKAACTSKAPRTLTSQKGQ